MEELTDQRLTQEIMQELFKEKSVLTQNKKPGEKIKKISQNVHKFLALNT